MLYHKLGMKQNIARNVSLCQVRSFSKLWLNKILLCGWPMLFSSKSHGDHRALLDWMYHCTQLNVNILGWDKTRCTAELDVSLCSSILKQTRWATGMAVSTVQFHFLSALPRWFLAFPNTSSSGWTKSLLALTWQDSSNFQIPQKLSVSCMP